MSNTNTSLFAFYKFGEFQDWGVFSYEAVCEGFKPDQWTTLFEAIANIEAVEAEWRAWGAKSLSGYQMVGFLKRAGDIRRWGVAAYVNYACKVPPHEWEFAPYRLADLLGVEL